MCCELQFNARSESISEKASFRRLIPKNRCLVAVEGYVFFSQYLAPVSLILYSRKNFLIVD